MNFSRRERLEMRLATAVQMEHLKAFDFEKAQMIHDLADRQLIEAQTIVRDLQIEVKKERDKT